MKQNEILKKVDLLMGAEKELIVLKGKLFTPQLCKTKEGNDQYYTFKLKTIKNLNSDEYGQTFNTYYCIMPVDVSKNFTENDISALKNNEVLCMCSASANTRTLTQSNITVNNITIYVNDIMLVRSIDSKRIDQKAINL